jgi:hypothetical protein
MARVVSFSTKLRRGSWLLALGLLALSASGCATHDLAFRDSVPWNSPMRESERQARGIALGSVPTLSLPKGTFGVSEQ